MRLAGAKLLLAPVLILQGRRVRRVALRLPEAEGARQGCVESPAAAGAPTARAPADRPRTLRLLIAGDSSAAGVGAERQSDALAGRLPEALLARAAELAIDRVEWRLEAHSGADAADVLARLERAAPLAVDLAVVAVGVNDVTGHTPPGRWLHTLERIAATLRSRHGARCVLVSGLPPMHIFPLLPQPLRWYLGEHARRFDAALRRWADSAGGVRYAPLPALSDPSMVATDGFHPSPAAYRLWAQALAGHAAEALRPPAEAGGSTGRASSPP